MPPTGILLVEPDTGTARALAACAEETFPGCSVLHAPGAESVERTDLRDITLALVADHPPACDAARVAHDIGERRPGLPIVAMMEEPAPERVAALLSQGVADIGPRLPDACPSVGFMMRKALAVSRLQRDAYRLHAGLTRSLAELVQRNRELAETADRLEQMASTDPLTRLNNRWWLKQRLDATFAVAARYGSDLSCMMIDLDGFKAVNDTHGHQHGDRVLSLTGELIAQQIRASDAAARYGGDEFIVLMPRTSADTAVALAQRLLRAFDATVRPVAEADEPCSMSIGIACLSISRPGAAETLIRHADLALYAAKRAGPGEIRICGPDGDSAQDVRAYAA
ncbi:MAG: diguanylate cyclase [Planctomycetota bacterium]|nr:MAG: diguanylate cyclase [Planctomycetota bacterium]